MIPSNVRNILAPYLANSTPWDSTNISSAVRLPEARVPSSTTFRVRSVVSVTTTDRLETAAKSFRGQIVLGRRFHQEDTAAGLALIGHELVHQEQYAQDPNFEANYDAAYWNTHPERPWENPYEYPAYEVERRIFCDLLAQGYPPGDWVPLGIDLWGC